MSDQLVIAIVGAVAGIVGGIVGAIASPIGKDWVAKRDHDRHVAREDELRKQAALERVAATHTASVRQVLDDMGRAMEQYGLAWRGLARGDQGQPLALTTANTAWMHAREIRNEPIRQLVDQWKERFEHSDMRYRDGVRPLGIEDLTADYDAAARALGDLLLASEFDVTIGSG